MVFKRSLGLVSNAKFIAFLNTHVMLIAIFGPYASHTRDAVDPRKGEDGVIPLTVTYGLFSYPESIVDLDEQSVLFAVAVMNIIGYVMSIGAYIQMMILADDDRPGGGVERHAFMFIGLFAVQFLMGLVASIVFAVQSKDIFDLSNELFTGTSSLLAGPIAVIIGTVGSLGGVVLYSCQARSHWDNGYRPVKGMKNQMTRIMPEQNFQ